MIDICGLYKSFRKKFVLKDVNLKIKKGEIFGLLGPNGAGKTTLIRSILKLVKIDKGNIFYENEVLKPAHIHKQVGFLPENFSPPHNLTGKEFLRILQKGLNGQKNIELLLESMGLKDSKDKKIGEYSRGMVQRLGLAMVLLKDPHLLILDEPILGLDVIGQRYMMNLLEELNREGKTIFFSSHSLNYVEKLCHRIGIIDKGEIKFTGTPQELKEKYHVQSLEEAFFKEIKRC